MLNVQISMYLFANLFLCYSWIQFGMLRSFTYHFMLYEKINELKIRYGKKQARGVMIMEGS